MPAELPAVGNSNVVRTITRDTPTRPPGAQITGDRQPEAAELVRRSLLKRRRPETTMDLPTPGIQQEG